VSIDVAPPNNQTVNLDLSCNIFEPGSSLDPAYDPDGAGPLPVLPYNRRLSGNAWGINVTSGLATWSTSGTYQFALEEVGKYRPAPDDGYTFAANVWPTVTRAPITQNDNIEDMDSVGWKSPEGWTSIMSLGGTTYYKYHNEFLGASFGLKKISVPFGNQKKFVRESGQIVTDSSQFDIRCDGLPGDPFVEPTSRPRGGNASARIGDGKKSYLLQNIPNPAARETIIGYHIDGKYERARIEFVELSSGKIKEVFGLKPTSPKAFVLSLKKYTVGLYGYKLIVDGKVLDTKKMLVQP
jgi:hypothetical protein